MSKTRSAARRSLSVTKATLHRAEPRVLSYLGLERRMSTADLSGPPEAGVPAAVAPAAVPHVSILDAYTDAVPSPQTAVDLFAGEWSSTLPTDLGVTAGGVGLFDDPRVRWFIDTLGGVEGRRVLELGPLEGGHTYMFDRAGASVDAVEANSRAYLKCLIAKELTGMRNARFLHGDFMAHLGSGDLAYDVVLASGVLYHQRDPLALLDSVAATAPRLALWTHYYDKELVREAGQHGHFTRPAETVSHGGRTFRLHPRDYNEALGWGGFCGGSESSANWMERDDLLGYLEALGYDRIEVDFDDPHHVNGPSFAVVAQRAG